MNYSPDKFKYNFYTYKNPNGGTTITAVSTYAGKTVKGHAKCNPEDTFDATVGQELAAARCGEKIAAKRVLRAADKYLEAMTAVNEATARFEKMKSYYIDAVDQHDAAVDLLNATTAKIMEQ